MVSQAEAELKLTISNCSLVPRLLGGGGKKEPGIHCLRMRLITTTFHRFCISLCASAHDHVTLRHGRTLYPSPMKIRLAS